jgi:hypothetical protein
MQATPFLLLLLFFILIEFVCANVEKVVFVAPTPLSQIAQPVVNALESAHLERLSPARPSLRHHLYAHFSPSAPSREQSEAWIRLDGLQPGQRYEVRVCWSATVGVELIAYAFSTDEASSQRRLILPCMRRPSFPPNPTLSYLCKSISKPGNGDL